MILKIRQRRCRIKQMKNLSWFFFPKFFCLIRLLLFVEQYFCFPLFCLLMNRPLIVFILQIRVHSGRNKQARERGTKKSYAPSKHNITQLVFFFFSTPFSGKQNGLLRWWYKKVNKVKITELYIINRESYVYLCNEAENQHYLISFVHHVVVSFHK